ncbi:helix-turn-helix transcriptional regulator [Rhizomonospora bruguierae]|uniref:helix-turn-helix transcriptional regulator n=1 Tax=Rhizomonospora bruguierae TaxID=1581705 RepID=UPI001BCE3A19|nr:WYL domain-containing protein [Micromonospora sp. NBRC 107566]
MSRRDRLSALVEELRAVAPRPRSARWLARRFEVSTRTVERDVNALQSSGVPIYAVSGRSGGYVLERSFTLHPLNVTPAEALAMSVALHRLGSEPLAAAARSALRKLAAVMPPGDADAARHLAARTGQPPAAPASVPAASGAVPGAVPPAVERALREHRVLRIGYADGAGTLTERCVEPVALSDQGEHGYLLAWCRLRGAPRVFRTDRLRRGEVMEETAPVRSLTPADFPVPASPPAPLRRAA